MLRSASTRVVPDFSVAVPTTTQDEHQRGRSSRTWHLSPRSASKRNSAVRDVTQQRMLSTANNNSNNNSLFPSLSGTTTTRSTPRRRLLLKSLRHSVSPRHLSEKRRERAADRNLIQFLTKDCPTDVLPKILAYAGPTATATLQQTSRHFRTVLDAEGTWRGLCEELYKWKHGDPEPASWKEHYRLHPCVPVDFRCVTTALAMAGAGWSKKQVKKRFHQGDSNKSLRLSSPSPVLEIPQSITVLVRPGHYEVTETIGISTKRRTTQVKIKRMDVPTATFCRRSNNDSLEEGSSELMDSCKEDCKDEVFANDVVIEGKTRRRNEPLIRVFRGQLLMDGIKLEHYSPGIDIWSGNAAIQIQPNVNSSPVSSVPPVIPEASAILNRVDIRSHSGRGVVSVEGGQVHMDDCHIHHCAATGVYIGGQGSKAVLKSTDVAHNGLGNQKAGGIARGHSGVYVEQGMATLENCSISNNTAAGISVIAQDNSALNMKGSEVLSNGCTPVELPNPMIGPDASNRVAVIGTPKPRSVLLRRSSRDNKHTNLLT